MTKEEFLKAMENALGKVELVSQKESYAPKNTHSIGVFVGGEWYNVQFKKEICESAKPSERLDCAIL